MVRELCPCNPWWPMREQRSTCSSWRAHARAAGGPKAAVSQKECVPEQFKKCTVESTVSCGKDPTPQQGRSERSPPLQRKKWQRPVIN